MLFSNVTFLGSFLVITQKKKIGILPFRTVIDVSPSRAIILHIKYVGLTDYEILANTIRIIYSKVSVLKTTDVNINQENKIKNNLSKTAFPSAISAIAFLFIII